MKSIKCGLKKWRLYGAYKREWECSAENFRRGRDAEFTNEPASLHFSSAVATLMIEAGFLSWSRSRWDSYTLQLFLNARHCGLDGLSMVPCAICGSTWCE